MTSDHQDDETLIEQLRDEVQAETTEAAVVAGRAGAETASRRWIPWTVAGCLFVSILTAAATAVALSNLGGQVAGLGTSVSEVRRLAEDAKSAGDVANAELARRGQQQVPIPQPGQAQDSDVLVAAAAARVLASLPDLRPTAAELGAAIAQYVSANASRFGPSPQQIGAAVAAHLTENPPPSGPPGAPGEPGAKGEKGDKGDPPTQQEIQAAFDAYIRDNPNALCPRGGSFSQLRVQLADGGTADTWTCVVQVTPSTTTQPSAVPLLPIAR
jgi:hypothetical protein